MLTISQVVSEPQIEMARDLLREYFAWWAGTEPEDFAAASTFQDIDQELAALPGVYAPPTGRLLLATYAGQAAGCVGLRRQAADTAEVKRLYVRPALRGLNIGWQLVKRLRDEARQSGYRRLVLDTHVSLTKARALYESLGFRPVTAPDDFPEQFKPFILFMECELSADQ